MIVVDASAVVAMLTASTPPLGLFEQFSDHLAAPHLLDVEVCSALRDLTLGGKLTAENAEACLSAFEQLHIHRFEFTLLAPRIWALRSRFTAYDATYIALAEGLDVPLVTCDRKLDVGGHNATIKYLETI